MWVTAALAEVTVGLCGKTAATNETAGITFISGTWWKGNCGALENFKEQITAWCFMLMKA